MNKPLIQMKKIQIALAACLATTHVFAANMLQPDLLLGALSRCDASFFASLGSNAMVYVANPYFKQRGSYGYFQVPNRNVPESSSQSFDPPLGLGSLEAVGYFDEVLDLGESGKYVSWGFLFRAPVGEVVNQLRSQIWEAQRLRKDDQIFVRSEVWNQLQKNPTWEKVAAIGGTVPKPGTIERVLLIEPSDDNANLTRFGCSLQGSVPAEMLKTERPDMGIE